MLAYCLSSELDSRVLLVDSRLKDGSAGITGRLGLEHFQGFTEFLRGGGGDLDELIRGTSVANVDVLPAGDQSGRTTPMDRDRLRKLLDGAKSRYDHVLLQVESPQLDTRAVITAIEAEAVFLLVRENRTFMTTLDDCRRVLIDNGVKDVRIVVTGAKA
jgi:MinD-like ATPase involved in chromosome partitioning or flagellar assembly